MRYWRWQRLQQMLASILKVSKVVNSHFLHMHVQEVETLHALTSSCGDVTLARFGTSGCTSARFLSTGVLQIHFLENVVYLHDRFEVAITSAGVIAAENVDKNVRNGLLFRLNTHGELLTTLLLKNLLHPKALNCLESYLVLLARLTAFPELKQRLVENWIPRAFEALKRKSFSHVLPLPEQRRDKL